MKAVSLYANDTFRDEGTKDLSSLKDIPPRSILEEKLEQINALALRMVRICFFLYLVLRS